MSRLRAAATFTALCIGLFSVVFSAEAQDEALTARRPIAAHDSLWMEELTWMEVRDLLLEGFTTVILSTGGIEANGPYTALGKHNVLMEQAAEAIAKQLGHTLIAPIVRFVPEGDIDPPSMHMRYPGTFSVREETFRSLLRDSCESLAQHGFNTIILIGDSYGNQEGMKAVAAELSERWKRARTRVYFVPEYYDIPGLKSWFAARGIKERPEGIHDDISYATMLLAIDPTLVRAKERQLAGRFSVNGVSLEPIESMQRLGREAAEHRVVNTVAAIRARLKADGRAIDMPLNDTARRRYRTE